MTTFARSSFGRIELCTDLITSESSAKSPAFGIQPEEFCSYRSTRFQNIDPLNPRFRYHRSAHDRTKVRFASTSRLSNSLRLAVKAEIGCCSLNSQMLINRRHFHSSIHELETLFENRKTIVLCW